MAIPTLPNYDVHDTTRETTVRELLNKLVQEKQTGEKKEDTKKKKKEFKFPMQWSSKMKKGQRMRDTVLIFYLNIKGEMEPPVLQPIYSGNMVIVRNKVYEVDPRAFWTVKIAFKMYKVLLLKEIDRRPVSNLDYTEIKRRGDATDADEFLIKAALRAQVSQNKKPINKWLIIGIVIAVIAVIVLFFVFGGGNGAAAGTAATTVTPK